MENNSIDLNIIQQGLSGSSWTAEKGVIDAASLHKVGEQRTDNSGALNALPTPFARFFVVNEAFRRLHEQRKNTNIESGLAYERLVSDCLDIYELLFNQEYHKARNEKIVIKEWVKDDSLPIMKQVVPILENSVSTYYNNDLGSDTRILYFIILVTGGKEYLLGTSSPMTGFITPPDLDKKIIGDNILFVGERYKNMPKLKKRGDNGNYYFKDVVLFDKRSEEFKNYMYNVIFGSEVNDRFAYIRDYIKSFATDPEIKNNYSLSLKPIKTEDNNDLEVNGIKLSYNKDVGNYFTDFIIRMPYKISDENFILPDICDDYDNEHNYLLPLNREAVAKLDLNNITLKLKRGGKLKVTLSLIVNEKEFKKVYSESPRDNEGKIVDLSKYKVNFDLALFPNVKSTINKVYNNYYKLMLVARDDNDRRTFSVDDITCEFLTKTADYGYRIIDEAHDKNYKSGVKQPSIRSSQSDKSACGTKYYELFNSSFDMINLKIRLEGDTYSGILIPKWRNSKDSQKSFIYAVDFGTTTTFVSKRERKSTPTEPEQLTMNKPILSYLHAKAENPQKNEIYLWEEMPCKEFHDYFQTEFIPAFIDGEQYKFPLRTAICRIVDEKESPMLFDNRNIAFSYGRKKTVGHHEVLTDIKWNEENAEIEAGIFIQELLLMIKYDVIQENANLNHTELIWFRPLSFKGNIRDMFERLWSNKVKEILGIEASQVKCYTESEAPYYYFNKKNVFKDISSVAVIDIGGGSTDFVFFENGCPKLANSVHFGCDVLWGNGYNQMLDACDNGIYQYYKDKIVFKSSELKELNNYLLSKSTKSTTKDIINFWLEHDDETDISSELQKNYRPLFLYHFASIIFYMAEMLKSKGLHCPRAILFSGNGSKYIDNFITNNIDILQDLIMIILKEEFPDNDNTIQLILPSYRKESTCYGGLYREDSDSSAIPYVFVGIDDKQYKNVEEIKLDFENGLCDKLYSQVVKLNKLYIEMLRCMIEKLNLEGIKMDEIEKTISKNIREALRTDFQKEILGKYDLSMPFGDSLFFLPIVDQILKLTKKK